MSMSHSRSIRVLVVEDEKIIANTLTAILRIRGYEATAFYSAEEALQWCHDQQPDAVITDAIVGPTNGIHLAVHLAITQPDCKVIILTGQFLAASALAESMARGFKFRIFPKPVHPQDILDFLETVHLPAPKQTV
jgi:DNA-binding NtrC family response regulator